MPIENRNINIEVIKIQQKINEFNAKQKEQEAIIASAEAEIAKLESEKMNTLIEAEEKGIPIGYRNNQNQQRQVPQNFNKPDLKIHKKDE